MHSVSTQFFSQAIISCENCAVNFLYAKLGLGEHLREAGFICLRPSVVPGSGSKKRNSEMIHPWPYDNAIASLVGGTPAASDLLYLLKCSVMMK